jgi:hypothetical protein
MHIPQRLHPPPRRPRVKVVEACLPERWAYGPSPNRLSWRGFLRLRLGNRARAERCLRIELETVDKRMAKAERVEVGRRTLSTPTHRRPRNAAPDPHPISAAKLSMISAQWVRRGFSSVFALLRRCFHFGLRKAAAGIL